MPRIRPRSASPDSARLAMVHQGEVVKVWDVATGRELCLAKFKDRGTMVSFSTDSNRLAVTCFGIGTTELHSIDAESGQEVSPTIKGTFARAMVFSPDGKRLVTGAFDGSVTFWELTSGQEILTLKGHAASVDDLAFSPGGHRLITVSSDMTVRVLDATPLPKYN